MAKRKLSSSEKAKKKKRQQEFMTIFLNGKQKRIKRPQTIDGMSIEEFIRNNADPIWLHQNEMWEEMDSDDTIFGVAGETDRHSHAKIEKNEIGEIVI